MRDKLLYVLTIRIPQVTVEHRSCQTRIIHFSASIFGKIKISCELFYLGGSRKKPVDRRLLSPLYLHIASLAKTLSPNEIEVGIFV